MRCRTTWLQCCLVSALLPGVAYAHTPIEGLGDFYNGMLHPIVVPAHLLALLGIGLLVGRQPGQRLQAGALSFLSATTLGLVSAGLGLGLESETLLLAGAASCGLLLAWGAPLPAWLTIGSGVVLGFAIGTDSSQDAGGLQSLVAALIGTGVTVYLVFLYGMAIADGLRKHYWQHIAIRIAGSWIAASAILVLALAAVTPV